MKYIGIIPARYASTRFPGKPLVDIHGKSMIQRVYEQCLSSKLDQVIVATDDDRIHKHVLEFGGESVMTSVRHKSGTDRIAEVVQNIDARFNDIVLNIQGDEPFINPKDINKLMTCFNQSETQIATLIKQIKTTEELVNTNCPKVVVGNSKQAIYFSREAIPHLKGIDKEKWLLHNTYYQHIGIYAFTVKTLNEICQLKQSPLEQSEGLEQLRWLENGYSIYTAKTTAESIAVDSPEDLKRINEKFFS